MNIRPFKKDDIKHMIELGAKMHQESNFKDLKFDKDKLIALGEFILVNPNMYYAVVAEDKNKCIIGMFVGIITEYYFSYDKVASDLSFYVEKDKRGALASLKMLKEFEKWAKRNGASEVRPSTSTGIEIERTRKLYRHLGYEVTGNTFRKVV
tara:strand:- start:311 stop:766 length:456 start_codon:yes stop_codon:yes gene_type:complete